MSHVTFLELVYLTIGCFYLLITFLQFPFPAPPASCNHISNLFFPMNLMVLFLMVNILSFADYLVSVWTIQRCHCNVGSYISYANKWALLCSNKTLFMKTCSKDLAGWPLSASSHHYWQWLSPSSLKSLDKQLFDFIQLVHKQGYIAFAEAVIKCSINLGMSYIVSVKVHCNNSGKSGWDLGTGWEQ